MSIIPATQQGKAGGSWVWDQPGNIVRTHLKKNQKKPKNKLPIFASLSRMWSSGHMVLRSLTTWAKTRRQALLPEKECRFEFWPVQWLNLNPELQNMEKRHNTLQLCSRWKLSPWHEAVKAWPSGFSLHWWPETRAFCIITWFFKHGQGKERRTAQFDDALCRGKHSYRLCSRYGTYLTYACWLLTFYKITANSSFFCFGRGWEEFKYFQE